MGAMWEEGITCFDVDVVLLAGFDTAFHHVILQAKTLCRQNTI
jgi:hypothetical protein